MTRASLDFDFGGSVAVVRLATPKANIIDREMVGCLDGIFEGLARRDDLQAVVLTADGPNFSYGASIEEHLPEEIDAALPRLSGLLRRIADIPVPTIAAVRGQCLGGGFELALACDLILAEEQTHFGLPEIRLGVFPPAASALLPIRMGLARATEVILTGRTFRATESPAEALVASVAPAGQLDEELRLWLETEFVPRSPVALRFAVRALRHKIVAALHDDLREYDRTYLEEMMPLGEAEEGIRAFLEKRKPSWNAREVLV